MDHRTRKALLILSGVQQIDIARKLGIHKSVVTNVMKERIQSDRVQKAIARAVKRPVRELFPNKTKRGRKHRRRVAA